MSLCRLSRLPSAPQPVNPSCRCVSEWTSQSLTQFTSVYSHKFNLCPSFVHALLLIINIPFIPVSLSPQSEGLKPDDFTWEAFQKFLDSLCLRPEIQSIFEER